MWHYPSFNIVKHMCDAIQHIFLISVLILVFIESSTFGLWDIVRWTWNIGPKILTMNEIPSRLKILTLNEIPSRPKILTMNEIPSRPKILTMNEIPSRQTVTQGTWVLSFLILIPLHVFCWVYRHHPVHPFIRVSVYIYVYIAPSP